MGKSPVGLFRGGEEALEKGFYDLMMKQGGTKGHKIDLCAKIRNDPPNLINLKKNLRTSCGSRNCVLQSHYILRIHNFRTRFVYFQLLKFASNRATGSRCETSVDACPPSISE